MTGHLELQTTSILTLLSWTPDPWRVHICKTSLKPSKVNNYIHNNNNIKSMSWVETCGHSQQDKQYCVYSWVQIHFTLGLACEPGKLLPLDWKGAEKTNKLPVTAIAVNNRSHFMALSVWTEFVYTELLFSCCFFFFFYRYGLFVS